MHTGSTRPDVLDELKQFRVDPSSPSRSVAPVLSEIARLDGTAEYSLRADLEEEVRGLQDKLAGIKSDNDNTDTRVEVLKSVIKQLVNAVVVQATPQEKRWELESAFLDLLHEIDWLELVNMCESRGIKMAFDVLNHQKEPGGEIHTLQRELRALDEHNHKLADENKQLMRTIRGWVDIATKIEFNESNLKARDQLKQFRVSSNPFSAQPWNQIMTEVERLGVETEAEARQETLKELNALKAQSEVDVPPLQTYAALEKMTEENKDLKAKCSDLEGRLSWHQNELQCVQAEVEAFNKALTDEKANYKRAFEVIKSVRKNYHKVINDLRGDSEPQQQGLDRLWDRVKESDKEIDKLQKELDEARKRYVRLQETVRNQALNYDLIVQERDGFRDELSQLREELEALRKERSVLQRTIKVWIHSAVRLSSHEQEKRDQLQRLAGFRVDYETDKPYITFEESGQLDDAIKLLGLETHYKRSCDGLQRVFEAEQSKDALQRELADLRKERTLSRIR